MKTGKFHTGIFERLSAKKQERILNIAVKEFADKGFLNSRIKEIAQKAGISYGSMYSYFPTKDDLLKTIITRNIDFQKTVFKETINRDDDIFENIKNFFTVTLKIAEENPELIAIWRDIAQSYHTKFLPEIIQLEQEGLITIRDLIQTGIARGTLSPDIMINSSAYAIDSISSELLASSVSDQNKKKKKMFFGEKTNPEIVDEIMIIVRKILPLKQSTSSFTAS
ncbi:MAG: TetR/AcrR family transcriptional regulator [Spirochaetales bacterium]|nr:TetR/AcrR family transcriptional regulator [Spirochaetales bacterium]